MDDPCHYGMGHGDFHIGNLFWVAPGPEEEYGHLHVFDWDEVCTIYAVQKESNNSLYR
jgi:hypothetical protein